ncbi:hypothetical protein BOX15_Mlig003372g1 [Macrostomum lignano]|uniref:Protein EFR3 homolog B n=1 Tax=Macrostomum lignano TaxID=282301 RepID=A0A267ET14_9PLAT|nr:hypothetical protein BOX15_Mlig003372g1 [Macrostomum lignano]
MPGLLNSLCGTCRPRWARLVDNVFPSDPNNRNSKTQRLNSLTHYTCRYPEKLGRIANYLERRLQRDLYRRRTGHVFVAISIADNLIKCCQRLDGLVCAYLSMVTSLVECEDRELQILGSASFCAYSAVDKETPNYLTEYAPLLERFVRMCLDSSAVSNRVRCAGLRGIVGLVRKIGSDDLQLNIWQELHMNQIVGAVLFNLEAPPAVELDEVRLDDDEEEAGAADSDGASLERPFDLAKEALDELLMRATFHNYGCVIGPVLAHLDANPSLWVPCSFALLVFRTLVTRAPKPGYAYTVVERLVGHLNSKSVAASTPVRQCVLQVVSGIVGFAAGDSVGPAVYNVFKELCCQLARSLTCPSPDQPAERQYGQELVQTMGRYAEAAPDTHKLEIMKYLLTYQPPSELSPATDRSNEKLIDELSMSLLSAVAMVADAYRSRSLNVALPLDLLGALLLPKYRLQSQLQHGRQRIAVLAALLDRRRCRQRLCPSPLPLFTAWPTPEDIADDDGDKGRGTVGGWDADPSASAFPLTRTGRQLLGFLAYELAAVSDPDSAQQLGICSCLLAVQCASASQGLVELHRLWVAAQDSLVARQPEDSERALQPSFAAGHAALAAYASLLCWATPGSEFRQHVEQVIKLREKSAPHLLPNVAFGRSQDKLSNAEKVTSAVPDELLFSVDIAESALQTCGLDTSPLRRTFDSSLVQPQEQRQRVATFGLAPADSNASVLSNSSNSNSKLHAPNSDARDYLAPASAREDGVQRHDSVWSLSNYGVQSERRPSRQFVSGGSGGQAAAALDLSFNAFRGIMFESPQERSRRRAREDQQLKELYTSATFDELLEYNRRNRAADIADPDEVSLAAADEERLGAVDISDVVRSIRACDACPSGAQQQQLEMRKTATIKEIEFPALFAY